MLLVVIMSNWEELFRIIEAEPYVEGQGDPLNDILPDDIWDSMYELQMLHDVLNGTYNQVIQYAQRWVDRRELSNTMQLLMNQLRIGRETAREVAMNSQVTYIADLMWNSRARLLDAVMTNLNALVARRDAAIIRRNRRNPYQRPRR